jgi:hypothetical protein
MKAQILSLIKKVADFLLLVSILTGIGGLVLTMIPELIETFGLNLTQENMAWLTGSLVGIGTFGGVAKYTSTTLRGIVALNKSDLETKIRYQSEKHQAEIETIKADHAEELQIFSESINELIDEVKHLRVENQKILEVNAITAKRNITSNLVSEEDKKLYQGFLKNIQNEKPSNLKNIYTTITNVIETIQKEKDKEEQDILSQALNDEIEV